MTLTAPEVARVAKQAGFTGAALVNAIAIAHAESGFNPAAIGDSDLTEKGERSVGLWQINYRPSRDHPGGLRDPVLNLQPLHNAVAAFAISGRGSSFTPWSTFTNGAYLGFVNAAAAAVAALAKETPMAPRIVGISATTDGYVIITDDGAVYAFGTQYHGRLTLDANGVWLPEVPK